MIYLIGGVPRAGKSQFSKLLAAKLNITRIDFDDITTVFEKIVPDYGLFMTMDQIQREEKAYPIVKSIIELYLWKNESVIIEGDNFRIYDWESYKSITNNQVKMVVFGYSNISVEQKIQINHDTTKDMQCWFEPLELTQKQIITEEMIERSQKIKTMVELKNDSSLMYFDTHDNFDKTFSEALRFILD